MWRLLADTLLKGPLTESPPVPADAELKAMAEELGRTSQTRIGRSLSIRAIDAGSYNSCELEIHALNNPYHDLERYGVRFVASPRHADVLLVTGPVTRNMAMALIRTYDATPAPKWVVAAGDCAVGCGVFKDSPGLSRRGGDGAACRFAASGLPTNAEAAVDRPARFAPTRGGATLGH